MEYQILQPSDALLLAELCEGLGAAREARVAYQECRNKGTVTAKRHRINYERNMAIVLKLADSFGLTPAGRMRLGLMRNRGLMQWQQMLADGDDSGSDTRVRRTDDEFEGDAEELPEDWR